MNPITLSLLTLAALGAAQNTTVSLILPGFDPQSLVGSVLAVDPKATTYVIACASGMGGGASATAYGGDSAATTAMGKKKRQAAAMTTAMPDPIPTGPSAFDDDSNDAQTLNCALTGTTKAVCTASASGLEEASDVSATPTATLTGSDLPSRLPVLITAGVEKLSAGAGMTTGTMSGGTMSGGTKTTGTANSGNGASKASGTAAGAAKSTGGAGLGFEPVVGMGVMGAVAVGLGAVLL